MGEKVLGASLAEAGLRFLKMAGNADALIPPTLATFASSCSSEDGAYGLAVNLGDSEVLERANSEWYRLAQHGGILDGVGSHFFVAVKRADEDPPHWWWARVELLNQWDIIGAGGASGILGNGRCRPSFVMLALGGHAILRGDVGQDSIDFSVVPEARKAQTLRRHGEWMATSPRVDEFTRAAITRWLNNPV